MVENKVWLGEAAVGRPASREVGTPIRVGWVGALRCKPSLDLLLAVADRMGAAVDIVMRGVIHRHAIGDLEAIIAGRSNVRYGGAYDGMAGLAEVYGGIDVVWAQDLWQAGANSDWLRPNRIYEAGWFGCPMLAVAGTETGRLIRDEELGWVVERAEASDVVACLEGLSTEAIRMRSAAILAMPYERFRMTKAELAAVIDRALGART